MHMKIFRRGCFFTWETTLQNSKPRMFHIDWEKENTGLLKKRWANWARFWSSRLPVECEAMLPLNVIDYVISNIPYKFRSREGEFIIEEMECEFGLNKIGNTQIKGYKDDSSPQVYTLYEWWQLGDIIWIDETLDFTGLERFYPLIFG